LVLILTIAVFAATALAVMAFYLLIEIRRESVPRRLKEISEPPSGAKSSQGEKISSRITDILKRFKRKPKIQQDDIVALITSEQPTQIRKQLMQAGYRHPASYQTYIGARVALPVLLFLLAVFFGKSMGMGNQKIFFLGVLGLVFGFIFPIVVLRWKIRRRQEEITDYLPDALDLLVVCVEAGLGLNASFVKISEEFKLTSPTLSDEFDIVNREMVAGFIVGPNRSRRGEVPRGHVDPDGKAGNQPGPIPPCPLRLSAYQEKAASRRSRRQDND